MGKHLWMGLLHCHVWLPGFNANCSESLLIPDTASSKSLHLQNCMNTHTLTRPTLPHFCQLCTPCLGHFNRPISCHPIINSPIGFSATLEGKSMASAFTPAATLGATLPAAFALRSSRRGSLAGRWASAGPPDKGRDLWKGYKWGCTLW